MGLRGKEIDMEKAKLRYQQVGRLAPITYSYFDEFGKHKASGSQCSPITMCVECGVVVANEEIHDRWHEKVEGEENGTGRVENRSGVSKLSDQ